MKLVILAFVLMFPSFDAIGQDGITLSWFDPASSESSVIKGQQWQNLDSSEYYTRLPKEAKKIVREAVFTLSRNTAGEYIDFKTDSKKIVIKYQLASNNKLNNMSLLGTSGVDLYAQDNRNKWHWIKAVYSFGDSVIFSYQNNNSEIKILRYRLYLPLYNTPKWLKIGVLKSATMDAEYAGSQAKYIFYGTSIMQGASASRAGMAWTNILGRSLDKEIINLGFSGNGRLEKPILDLMSQTKSDLFVLDCQPNLYDKKIYPAEVLFKMALDAVKQLRIYHPNTPVILCEHSSGAKNVNLDSDLIDKYLWSSSTVKEAYQQLKRMGDHNLYLLSAKEIGFTDESTVDGTHPNDIGMKQYSDAYLKKIRKVLKIK